MALASSRCSLYRSGNLSSNATVPKPSKFRSDKLPPPPSRPVAGRSKASSGSKEKMGGKDEAAGAWGEWHARTCDRVRQSRTHDLEP